jgi:hypothetical protein
MTYTEAQINQAINRVETAKQNNPQGWVFLRKLNLPDDELVIYAFTNAKVHAQRLGLEDDPALLYAAAWLNGVAIGVALGEQRDATDGCPW